MLEREGRISSTRVIAWPEAEGGGGAAMDQDVLATATIICRGIHYKWWSLTAFLFATVV
jgi:hypothetical protein